MTNVYLGEIAAEKSPAAVRGAKYVFDAWILPELGTIQVEKLTTDRLNRWRNKIATQPKRVRSKRTASEPATRKTADDDDGRRARKATANRILTVLKAALNRAFHADRVAGDGAWRKVRPFKRVDEAVIRYLSVTECRRLVGECPPDFRKLVQAALLTGCRYSELTRLKCEGFNRDSGTPAIRLGKGKVRHVILTDEGQKVFTSTSRSVSSRPCASRITHVSFCVMPTSSARSVAFSCIDATFLRADGNAWGASHQKRPLDEASGQAGVSPAVNFHILRHTYASHLAMRGVPMGVIAAQLGHADTRMTEKHYAHLSPSYVAQTIRANFPVLNLAGESQVVPLRRRVAT